MNTRINRNLPNELRDLSRFLPFSVGLDKLFEELEANTFGSTSGPAGYPPYNIERLSDDDFLITIAVAGFSANDVNVEVEGKKLTVKAKSVEAEKGSFLHRGIARRGFERSFILGEHIEVQEGSLVDGMLNISLKRIVPESAKPRTIALNNNPLAKLSVEQKVDAVEISQEVTEKTAA